ncbi:MAG: lipoate--protein ligase [Ruminococcaceae bacterium]|nr:lipoate--protein ligase [Oscillospiraceae bacterium]
MRYIESPSHDAWFNMALEEYVFESLDKNEDWFMLWQNNNTIVVGKYQNTIEEINAEYVKDNNISIVRRLSGGGAMYQDMGNLNFTFVVDQDTSKTLDFGIFIQPVIKALAAIGVTAERNSRNDITIEDQKFSGNSQYNKRGRTMHHGTLLFNADLNVVGKALQVKADKIESKGVKSVRSRVTNILPHMKEPITLEQFKKELLAQMFEANSLEEYKLTDADIANIQKLRDEKYITWDWNYGKSPAYNMRKERRYPFGGITVTMDVEKGVIRTIRFNGDFFGNGDILELCAALEGQPLTKEAVLAALKDVDVNAYIMGMDADTMVDLLLY